MGLALRFVRRRIGGARAGICPISAAMLLRRDTTARRSCGLAKRFRRALCCRPSAAAACDLFLSVGTSSVVHPAAGLIDLALQHGASVLEVNPMPTPYSSKMRWSLRGLTGKLLPELIGT